MAENQGGGDKLIYFLIGAGIGAITALFFAPKAGRKLRWDIADATRKGLDYARDTGHEIGERASTYYQTSAQRVSDREIYRRLCSGSSAQTHSLKRILPFVSLFPLFRILYIDPIFNSTTTSFKPPRQPVADGVRKSPCMCSSHLRM
jgi:gas vesicle protein